MGIQLWPHSKAGSVLLCLLYNARSYIPNDEVSIHFLVVVWYHLFDPGYTP